MSRRVNASLREEEIAALEAHPEYAGSLGGLLRVLALRQLGLEPADAYADHRNRPRDEKGRIISMETETNTYLEAIRGREYLTDKGPMMLQSAIAGGATLTDLNDIRSLRSTLLHLSNGRYRDFFQDERKLYWDLAERSLKALPEDSWPGSLMRVAAKEVARGIIEDRKEAAAEARKQKRIETARKKAAFERQLAAAKRGE